MGDGFLAQAFVYLAAAVIAVPIAKRLGLGSVLGYLMATQNPDGHWHQNQWLGGRPYWPGVQLDETAFPVLLAVSLSERAALGGMPVADMTRRALAFLLREGPSSPQDRWEEDAGVNPYTLAVCIAALVAGAELLPEDERELPLCMADFWNARLEDWCVARDSALDQAHGIAAHYVREAPVEILGCPAALRRHLAIRNRADDDPGGHAQPGGDQGEGGGVLLVVAGQLR